MEQSIESGDVSIRGLGGLNERVSPLDLPPNEFSTLRGYYPSQQGLLSRLPGKEFLFQLDGTILSIHPTYNSEGHVLIQTTENLYLTTVDEIQGRSTVTNLNSNPNGDPATDQGTAYQVIFYGKYANGTNGPTSNVRVLTDLVIPDGFQSFIIAWSQGQTGQVGAVTISAGSYLIEALATNYSVDTSLIFKSQIISAGGILTPSLSGSESIKNTGIGNVITRSAAKLVCTASTLIWIREYGFNAQASVTLTATGQPTNNQTITIGGKVYTMKTTLVAGEGNIKIGVTFSETLSNLYYGINADAGTFGIRHNCAIVNANCNVTEFTGTFPTSITAMKISAIALGAAGNGIAITETLSNMTLSGTTTTGGIGPTIQGQASSLGENEIYTILKISKLA